MSRLQRLLRIAAVLAVIALVANIGTIRKLIRRESRLQAQLTRRFSEAKPIDPVGSEDAKVRVTVFAQSMNECHAGTIELVKKLGEAAPDRIRVEFKDTATEEGYKAADAAGIGCEAGLLVNDRSEIEVEQDGHLVMVSFHGPLGMEMPPDLLRLGLERELESQYPDGLTDDERNALTQVWETLPDEMMMGGSMPGWEGSKGHMEGEAPQTEAPEEREASSTGGSEETNNRQHAPVGTAAPIMDEDREPEAK